MAATALARRFRVDVSTDNATWLQLVGMTDFNPQITPTKTDATTYDTNGWMANEIPLNAWSLTIKALRQPTAGVYPPSQELVRAAQGQFGTAARVYVRWYDKTGAPEAWSGQAIVEWNASKTGVADLNEVQITLTGDGILTPISNPYAAAAVPAITSAFPVSGATTGSQIQIFGSGFVGTVVTTGVKVGATNMTSWVVVSDSLIVAIMPSGSAGATTLTVTNAAGASNTPAYTRGA